MVSIGVQRTRPRASLNDLLVTRDASLRLRGNLLSAALVRARRRLTSRVGAAGRVLLLALSVALAQICRHGLVVGGLSAFVLAGALHSATLGLVIGGASLLFLELRRR